MSQHLIDDPTAALSPQPEELDQSLQQMGYESFRPGQRESIEALLERDRLLLVAPTGGGKSLIYQLPAAILPGTTLVVSPLISLMNDQVLALQERGVAATFLASTLDGDEMRQRLDAMRQGAYKLVYVSPERLAFNGFRALLSHLDCPLVAIDEAHCISEWGHDFRPEYLQIAQLRNLLPKARILACTATATPVVRDEIIERLGLPADTPQIVRGFARPNLALQVQEVQDQRQRQRQVDTLLTKALGRPGHGEGTAIVYAPTRKSTEEEARRLGQAGWRVAAYHAGLDAEVRDTAQRAFAAGQTEVVVATNAFGMGIDRADVRAVVHLAPPSSIEAYYQEVGRAGRDGEKAVCLLLISPGDMTLRRHLISSDIEGRTPDPESARHKWNLFLELMRWSEGGTCRHDAILRYFGDEEETLAGCGRCDICLQFEAAPTQDPEEAALTVRKALCGAARVHGRYGIQVAARLLRGDSDPRLSRAGLHQTPTYGTLSTHSEQWLLQLLRRCVTAGWLDFTGGNRPMVVVTQEGLDVIHERRPARLLLPPLNAPKTSAPLTTGYRRRPSPTDEVELDDTDQALFDALRRHRMEVARSQDVPPYVVASDRTLRDIVLLKPANTDELQMAHGIGPSKVEKYGRGFLQVLADLR
ncbi:MAG: RecQ family ATP-dependent DNA helicase [Candidatus Latescibacteria bacterium]|nr:RecQ family ATP-dependent DNA helicase [Candidatus Latescibacterota bacterium]